MVKKALISSVVMGHPINEGREFILDVDLSDVGLVPSTRRQRKGHRLYQQSTQQD